VETPGPAVGALIIGDVLLRIGPTAATFKDLSKVAARLAPDSLVTLTILRSGAQQSVAMKVGRLPDPVSDPALRGGQDVWVPTLGMGVADTTAEIRKAIKAGDETTGFIVTQLRPAAPGALAGIRVGDLVTHLGAKQFFAATDIAAIGTPTPQNPVLLRVVHDGSPVFIVLTGQSPP
jgi:serine protease Do